MWKSTIKKMLAILLVLLCGFFSSCEDQNKEKNEEKLSSTTIPNQTRKASVSNLSKSLDEAIQSFFSRLSKADTIAVLKCAFQDSEYIAAFEYIPDITGKEHPDKAADLFTSTNKTNALYWLGEFHKNGYQFLNYKVVQKPLKGDGFTLIKGISLWVTNPEGKAVEFPAFKTVVKLKGGFKIWSFLKH